MKQAMRLVVYPVKDIVRAKALYRELLQDPVFQGFPAVASRWSQRQMVMPLISATRPNQR